MHSLSKNYLHLYFPIDWNSASFNSRAIAYLINRHHQTMVSQLTAMFGSKNLKVITVNHTKSRVYSINCYELTRLQTLKYLVKYPNRFQNLIQKQLDQGLTLDQVECNFSTTP